MPQTTQQNSQTDPDVVAAAKSFMQVESGGDFNAKGKSGESGVAQWTPDTWKAQAKSILGDENAQMTPENQKAVLYVSLKKDKDAGLSLGQSAAKWNSGSPDGWENKVGTNKYGVAYNVPQYVKKITDTYRQIKGQSQSSSGGFNPTPYSNPTGGNPGQFDVTGNASQATQPQPDQGFIAGVGSDIAKRTSDAGTALSDIPASLSGKGTQSVASDVLQAGGAVGGLIGDVTNRAIDNTPIVGTAVKGIENLLGKGVGALAQTPVGQSVVKSVTDWSKAHPELSKDIGAGFNIVTAIPILRGLGAVKSVAGDAVATALKGVAEKGAIKDLTATAARTVGGRKAIALNPDGIKTLVDERALPDIQEGKYTTAEADQKLNDAISQIDDHELQPVLDKASTAQISSRIPLDQYRKEAVANAVDELKDTGPVEKYFDKLQAKYGDYPTLQQMNEAKRLVSKNISEAGFNSPTYSTDKVVRSILQKSVEDGAQALGLSDVAAINQKMRRLFKAQDMLKHIDRKPVKIGMVGGLLKDVATAGGEIAGNSTGIPLAGAYIGRESGGFLARKLSGLKNGVLERTGKDAVKTSVKSTAKKAAKGFLGARVQGSVKNP